MLRSARVWNLAPLAAYAFCDGLQMCLTGIIVGAGRQRIAAPICVVSYWLLGLPLGAALAFLAPPRLGLLGLW